MTAMIKTTLTIAALALASAGAPAMAQTEGKTRDVGSEAGFALGPHVSTLGLGGEASVRLSDRWVLRLGGNYLALGTSEALDGVTYDLDLTLASAGGALDLHPFANGFLISAGVYWNGNKLDASATPTTGVTIGTTTFTPAEIGRIDGDIEFNSLAPYLGIGWDGSFFGDGALSLKFRAGLFYMGKPDVTLRATGTLAGSAALQADLAREESNIESELDLLAYYPAVTLGVTYRF